MSLQENKAIVRRLYEAQNNRDPALLHEFVASDLLDRGHKLRGLEEYKKFVTMVGRGFPDYYETIEDIISEGDRVWVRYKFTGTHKGEYRGLSPTEKNVTFTA